MLTRSIFKFGYTDTGVVDLSKILGRGTNENTGRRYMMVINDESIGVSHLLGARARTVPRSLRFCMQIKQL